MGAGLMETLREGDVAPEFTAVRRELYSRLRRLVDRVSLRMNYRIHVGMTEGMKYPYLQVQHYRADTNTGVWNWGHGGKMYVSEWSTDSEVFQGILGLLIAYETHEVREGFRVDGVRAYGPHVDVEAHKEIAHRLDVR